MRVLKHSIIYMVYAACCMIPLCLIPDIDLETYLTMNLVNQMSLDMASVMFYIMWALPGIIIIFHSGYTYCSFFGDHDIYYAIRGKQSVLFMMIIKKIFLSFMIFFLVKLLLGFVVAGIYPETIDQWILFIQYFMYLLMLVLLFIIIKILIPSDQLLNMWIAIIFGSGFLVIQWNPDEVWYDILLQQKGLLWFIVILFAVAAGAVVLSIKLLENRKG